MFITQQDIKKSSVEKQLYTTRNFRNNTTY